MIAAQTVLRFYVGFLLTGLLAGCAPDPVYRLDARAPDASSIWQRGRQVVTHTVDSVQVAMAYTRTTDTDHKFRLAFVNRSSASITVDPLGTYGVVTEKLSTKERIQISRCAENTPNYVYRRDILSTADATEDTEAQLRCTREQADNRRTQSQLSQRRARWTRAPTHLFCT